MVTSSTFIRVNGRGNAWPVFLGSSSEFYDAGNSEDLSNASFSIINYFESKNDPAKINWEVLIDAGNHTVPFLIQHGNRIPNAVLLTHGHMDHTLGLDWVAQSRYYLSDKREKLSVYATFQVWKFVVQSYPHLQKIITFKSLSDPAPKFNFVLLA
jgi:ribonuclease BN (tRNA processing enzyme)